MAIALCFSIEYLTVVESASKEKKGVRINIPHSLFFLSEEKKTLEKFILLYSASKYPNFT